MKIDFTCPAELLNVEYIDNSCRFYIHNLVEDIITACELKLANYDENDILLYEQTIKFYDLALHFHEPIKLDFEMETVDFVVKRELSIDKIYIGGANNWHSGMANEFTYNQEALPDGRALSSLRMIAGKDAIAYPEEQGDIWVCICGRANRIDEENCRRCARNKEDVFARFNKDSVTGLIDNIKAQQKQSDKQVIQEAAAMKDRQERIVESKQKRRKNIMTFCISLVILFFAFLALWHYGLPAYRSLSIDKKIEQGNYREARTALDTLPNRYDVSDRIKLCDYKIAKENMDSATEKSLADAIYAFEKLGDYKDSKIMLQEAKYKLGNIHFDASNFDKALKYYKEVEHFSDASLKITEINYKLAIKKLESGDLQGAKDIFTTIESYSDSRQQLIRIDYELGKKAFADGNMDKAMEYFNSSLDYEDAEEWFFKTLYTIAEKSFKENDLETAGENYLLVAKNQKASLVYKDALIKANSCLYEVAKQALDNKEYERAANTFSGILEYLDSKDLYTKAIRELAMKRLDDGNYDEAIAFLNQIDTNDESQELLKQVKYKQAESLENTDIDKAVELYKDIQDYKDAKDKYLAASYAKAEKLLADAKYDEAAFLFTSLADYADSSNRRKDCLYAKAEALLAKNNLLEAKDIFLSLEGYSDANIKAKDIVVKLAKEYMSKKEYLKAIDMLQSIAKTDDTDALLCEARYVVATSLLDEGKIEEAVKELELVPNYRDSDSLLADAKYKLAQSYESKGEHNKASRLFAELGNYKDASIRATQAFDSILESPAMLARQAFGDNRYSDVLLELKDIDIEHLPEKYADLKNIYQASVYAVANEAYNSKNIAKALQLYRSIEGYEGVDKKLRQDSFRLIGSWISDDRHLQAQFNEDGSCNINGEEYKCYFVKRFKLYVGQSFDTMEHIYNLSKWTNNSVNFKEVNGGKRKIFTMQKRSNNDADTDNQNVTVDYEPIVIPLDKPTPTTSPVPIKLD